MKPILSAFHGEPLPHPPVWLMRQAGRYLPEYRTLRAKAKSFVDFCLCPDLAAEVTLQPVHRFNLDAAILFADILLIPHALGQEVRFLEGEGPRLAPVRDAAALARLSDTRILDILEPVMQTIRTVRAALPKEATLIGFAGAPWTVATYMIEGQGGTDFELSRQLAWREPEMFGALIEQIVSATIQYLIAQADAGAEVLQLFDSWAGSVPASLFDRVVIEPTARIVQAVKAVHPHIPIIGFPRAAGAHLGRYARNSGVDGVGVDHMTDLSSAAQAIPEKVVLQGNMDPTLLLVGGAQMNQDAKRILAAMQGRRFIFNLGHGVMQQTPPDHVAQLVSLIRGI